MDATGASLREVAVPAIIFTTLRRELAKEAGDLPTIHALHAAGYAAGVDMGAAFVTSLGAEATEIGQGRFWSRLSEFLSRRGWGTVAHEDRHRAVGLLTSPDWVEASDADGREGCSFTTGLLSGLLTRAAGGPVAVLEVSCRCRGDDHCAFAFGSEEAIHDLYGELLDGADLSGALASL